MSITTFIRSLTLRIKLILLAMITSAMALIVVSVLTFTNNERENLHDFQESLHIITRVLADRSVVALEFNDTELATRNLGAVEANRSIFLACIYDINNEIFATYRPENIKNLCPSRAIISKKIPRSTSSIEHIITSDNTHIGTIVIYANLNKIREQTIKSIYFSLSTAILAIIVSFIFALYFQQFISKPIQTLGMTMSDVQKSNDFSIRAKKNSEDELGNLVDAFNQMLNKIEIDTVALKSSEEKFRKLSSASPAGIFQMDSNGRIVYANKKCMDTVELSSDMNINDWAKKIHPDDKKNLLIAWQKTLDSGDDFKIEFRFILGNTNIVSVLSQAKALYNDNEIIGFVGSLLDISDLKIAQSKLEHMALYDPLTNIPNRLHFNNCLDNGIERAIESNTNLAVLFIDIDEFKRINDSLGHDIGDELLKTVAKRIQSSIRPMDVVARLGGDEFIVFISDLDNQDITDRIAHQLLNSLREPIKINQYDVHISVSIGISIGPSDSSDSKTLMKNADLAMFQAKALGKNNFQYFSHELNEKILHRVALEKDIRVALEEHEFFLVYQPKFCIRTNIFIGFEALLRCNSKTRGFISPVELIPVAEEIGLIVPIGEWVIQAACKDIKHMLTMGIIPANGRVAINLSLKQFKDANLIENVMTIITSEGVNPQNIEFEITETTLIENVGSTLKKLNILKQFGITIAIDDFGTGYSSLSYLKQLPIDYLKIDRSFISSLPEDNNDSEITAAIIAMSHKLGLSVVAEGVETAEQLAFITKNHCDIAQGYYFGKGETMDALIKDVDARPHYYAKSLMV